LSLLLFVLSTFFENAALLRRAEHERFGMVNEVVRVRNSLLKKPTLNYRSCDKQQVVKYVIGM
jgi:hypothetical protein